MDSRELQRTLVLATAFKEGDLLLGGTRDERVRADACRSLLDMRLLDIRSATLIDDGVTEALARSLDRDRAREIDHLSIAQLKSILLGRDPSAWVARYGDGLSSESIGALVRVLTNDDLLPGARALQSAPGYGDHDWVPTSLRVAHPAEQPWRR
jgi:ethanolamine ammonia-lyase large subunit